ncbi:cation transporter [Planosporangium thailandense]|uniref:Cation transporter n=1 Tax=Planosporangium thailandense TaxID=765197 RepID=A0ABX0XZH3_9ACTN|nr:cation transporter [Planosporangium thailandense]
MNGDQSHRHGHGHGHGHGLPAGGPRRPLAIVLAISTAILAVEVVGALLSGSLALLADAGHLLTDVAGLALALVAAVLAGRPATDTRTWGYRRAEVLAAAAQAAVLLAVGGFVLAEGVRRLLEPPAVASGLMVVFGAIGLAGNAVSIAVLSRVRGGNLNIRAALLEVVNDALGAGAVLAAAVVIAYTGWTRADAVASLLIGAMIVPRTWRLLRETVDVLMEATPKGVDLAAVRAHILALAGVREVHDLHASSVASDLPVLTAHVVVDDGCFRDGQLPVLLDRLQQCLAGHFDVAHSTFQFEPAGHATHEHPTHR